MKFGRKRSSPEPEPVDITHRLSILDLRASVRADAAAAAPAPAAPAAQPPVVATAAPVPTPPVPPPPAAAPAPPVVVPEAAAPAVVAQPAPALPMPDAAAYEMARFELSSPSAVAAPAPSVEQQPDLHPVAAWEQASPEQLAAPPSEPAAPPEQPIGWGMPAEPETEPEPEPEPDYHPVAEWEAAEASAAPDTEMPEQRSEESPAGIDLTEPATEAAPEVDLTERVEHDPVYAAVDAAARQARPQDDEGVVRWRW